MIKEICFCPIDGVNSFKQIRPTVLISILDKGERAKRESTIKYSGFIDVLKLSFEDTYEEVKLSSKLWEDEPSEEEHALHAMDKGERAPTLSDALEIKNFFLKHHGNQEEIDLLVHCYGGISRSAAVAYFLSTKFFIPLNTCRCTDSSNKRVLRLLEKAFLID